VKWRNGQPSLPQTLAYAVAKAVIGTLAVFVAYVGGAVVTDMAQLADGRRTPPAEDVARQTGELLDIPGVAFVEPVD
jgi:hypothetical protein